MVKILRDLILFFIFGEWGNPAAKIILFLILFLFVALVFATLTGNF